ncbi:Pyridine nucleotide-disulfide oxidoreductase, FAD/NAD(P)-binding domain protein [Kalmanozyma brasiliensis GHG001]|uniref:FAD/NAD(P)-binding domain-containing protein n=1 Tax=Kalmanozyma brasiliensis (strain GHG001) TaxID=1365824 RepID=V5EWY1_KALBG|nr:Pyridine nucleotide-disulfide oxidoreductase, FAD/NAD(P)-binding domain protein [Kalmanozyma brasiliensis GHG001]EST07913.1 Pyridine nucleotide-disulfide oxidoreductase, FAD/NAD(P)-binding domain protein [Kalmanozyma brasiliensis GHG001]
MSTELKNVVVIGAATAGITVVQTLAKSLPPTHRIVLIEANPVAYWSIGALRASVAPGFETKVVHDLNGKTVFGAETRHVVLAGTRVVDLHPEYVIVSRDVSGELSGVERTENGSKVAVDRVILAVGSDYGFPMRIDPSATTKEDVLEQFRKTQKEVAAAQEILVVGGGPTGVEFVGEVLDEHPNKVVTLLTRGSLLVSNGKDDLVGVGKKLLAQLQEKGVRVILDDSLELEGQKTGPLDGQKTFTTKNGKEIKADFLMIGSGGKSNTAWIKKIDFDLVDDKGLIKTTSTFNLDSSKWGKYYAVGDAANTPGLKTSQMAGKHAVPCAQNVLAAIKGEKETKKAAVPSANFFVVPLGRKGGASYMGVMTVGGWPTGMIKGKDLFLGMFEGWFKA